MNEPACYVVASSRCAWCMCVPQLQVKSGYAPGHTKIQQNYKTIAQD